jgi:hypothetical protein
MLGKPNGRSLSTRTRGEQRASLRHVAARYGFRRVERVHVVVNDGVTLATVAGIVHRYPRCVPVPLSVAIELVAAGARLTVEHLAPPPEARV